MTDTPKLRPGYNKEFDAWYLGGPMKDSFFKSTNPYLGFRLEPAPTAPKFVMPQKVPVPIRVIAVRRTFGTGPNMGTDPEFFVAKAGKIVPAFEVLPSKREASLSLGNPWFWDGFQAETTVDPATCHQHLNRNIARRTSMLAAKALTIVPKTVWRVPDEHLEGAAEEHVALGCDPSFNAYKHRGYKVPDARKLKWRFAGGHLHFGIGKVEDEAQARYIVKTLDAFLGVPSVALAQNFDHPIRRRYYGLAGEFRLPPHGIEYRTLSNFWAFHKDSAMLVTDLARHAFNLGRARLLHTFVGSPEEIQNVINYSDVRGAKALMKLNRDFYDAFSLNAWYNKDAFWRAIDKGVDAVIPDFGKDILGVWNTCDGDLLSTCGSWATYH